MQKKTASNSKTSIIIGQKQTKIILVAKNRLGNTVGFITNAFETLTLENVIDYVRKGWLQGLHLVETIDAIHVRSDRNQSSVDNLSSLLVPAGSFSKRLKNASFKDKVIFNYIRGRGRFLELKFSKDDLIYIDRTAYISKEEVRKRFRPLISDIKRSAKHQKIEPSLLAAILVNELAESGPDDLFDILGYLGVNATVGLAQVKLTTARLLIKNGYYQASPTISDQKLYNLLTDDHEAVKCAAAYIRFTLDHRIKRKLGITPEHIATAYSRGYNTDVVSERGRTIIKVFVPVAKELLSP
jgi:hypothetical protein